MFFFRGLRVMMWSSQNRCNLQMRFNICPYDKFEVWRRLVLFVVICGKMECCSKLGMSG
jgi:hypothetical protein